MAMGGRYLLDTNIVIALFADEAAIRPGSLLLTSTSIAADCSAAIYGFSG